MNEIAHSEKRVTRILLAFTAPFVVLVTPFAKFIAFRDYGFFHPEVGVVIFWHFVLIIPLVLIGLLRPRTLLPAVLSLLALSFILSEVDIRGSYPVFTLSQLTDSPHLAYASVILALVGLTLVAGWMIWRHIALLITGVFAAILISTVVLPQPVAAPTNLKTYKASSLNATLPPVLHVVLDQQIAIEGFPASIAESKAVAMEMRSFYQNHGFSFYSRAFTHFPATLESIPNLLNNHMTPDAIDNLKASGPLIYLKDNKWFSHLSKSGYAIDVYQSRYIDFCGPPDAPVANIRNCLTYDQADVRAFHKLDMATTDKARLLRNYYLRVDHETLLTTTLYLYSKLRSFLDAYGIGLPEWNFKLISPSPLITLDIMKQLNKRISTLQRGEAVFAHLLAPHDPFIVDNDCAVKSNPDHWTGRSNPLWKFNIKNSEATRTFRYDAYISQVRCTHQQLGVILEELEKSAHFDDMTIIIHGDHGSMISSLEAFEMNQNVLSDRDLIDNYATHFAYKKPGILASEHREQRSIQSLFAEHIMGTQGVSDHPDIFLKPNKGIVGKNQVRRPMPPIRP